MPRPKYTITCDDLTHVRSYLEFQLRIYGVKLRQNVKLKQAENEFATAVTTGSKSERAAQVNSWCEHYLSGADWQKLKAAIRKRRERMINHADSKSITISALSHEYLANLAKRHDITFSEVLERYLSKALKQN